MSTIEEKEKDFEITYSKNDSLNIKFSNRFLAISGAIAAAFEVEGYDNLLLDIFSFAGEIGGALMITKAINSEPTFKKSAFLLLGGVALGCVTNNMALTPLLHQVTGAMTFAGIGGLIFYGVKNIKFKKP